MPIFPPMYHFHEDTSMKDIDVLNKYGRKYGLYDFVRGNRLGEGSFGVVYKYTALYNGNPVSIAVKKTMVFNADILAKEKFKDLIQEADNSMFMSSVNIGPKVYGVFNVDSSVSTLEEDKKRRKPILPIEDRGVISQFLLMEPFDMDGSSALYELSNKDYIVSEMIRLLKEQIFRYDLLCYDIKSHNYIVRATTENGIKIATKVRMIDFSGRNCRYNTVLETLDIDLPRRKQVIFILILVQLFIHIYSVIPQTNFEQLLVLFDREPLFVNRFKYRELLYHMIKLNSNEFMFIHYTKGVAFGILALLMRDPLLISSPNNPVFDQTIKKGIMESTFYTDERFREADMHHTKEYDIIDVEGVMDHIETTIDDPDTVLAYDNDHTYFNLYTDTPVDRYNRSAIFNGDRERAGGSGGILKIIDRIQNGNVLIIASMYNSTETMYMYVGKGKYIILIKKRPEYFYYIPRFKYVKGVTVSSNIERLRSVLSNDISSIRINTGFIYNPRKGLPKMPTELELIELMRRGIVTVIKQDYAEHSLFSLGKGFFCILSALPSYTKAIKYSNTVDINYFGKSRRHRRHRSRRHRRGSRVHRFGGAVSISQIEEAINGDIKSGYHNAQVEGIRTLLQSMSSKDPWWKANITYIKSGYPELYDVLLGFQGV